MENKSTCENTLQLKTPATLPIIRRSRN